MHGSLSIWYFCQQDIQLVRRVLQGVCHVPGPPAVSALSHCALLAQRGVCGGVSEVLFLLSATNIRRRTITVHHFISYSPCILPSGFPQGGVCQPCDPQCASCRGNSSYCLSCETQYLLLDNSCRSHCPEGFYAADRECHRCPVHCAQCTQDGLCNGKYRCGEDD